MQRARKYFLSLMIAIVYLFLQVFLILAVHIITKESTTDRLIEICDARIECEKYGATGVILEKDNFICIYE